MDDLAKAAELRTKEATGFVTACTAGKLSPKEAEERLWQYSQRWPEALPGTHSFKGATDAALLAEIDETRRPDYPERAVERFRQGEQGRSAGQEPIKPSCPFMAIEAGRAMS